MPEKKKMSTAKIVFIFLIVFLIISIGILTIKNQNSTQVEFDNIGYFEKGQPPARVLTYYTTCEDMTKIKEHAKRQSWEEGAILQVFYFDEREFTPNVDHLSLNFDSEYKEHCIAFYRKLSKGRDTFQKYPYKN